MATLQPMLRSRNLHSQSVPLWSGMPHLWHLLYKKLKNPPTMSSTNPKKPSVNRSKRMTRLWDALKMKFRWITEQRILPLSVYPRRGKLTPPGRRPGDLTPPRRSRLRRGQLTPPGRSRLRPVDLTPPGRSRLRPGDLTPPGRSQLRQGELTPPGRS